MELIVVALAEYSYANSDTVFPLELIAFLEDPDTTVGDADVEINVETTVNACSILGANLCTRYCEVQPDLFVVNVIITYSLVRRLVLDEPFICASQSYSHARNWQWKLNLFAVSTV